MTLNFTNNGGIQANGQPLSRVTRNSFDPRLYRKALPGEAPLRNGVPTPSNQLPAVLIGDGWVVDRRNGNWANVGSGNAMRVYEQSR